LQKLDILIITIQFGLVTQFDNNKGVLLPTAGENEQFHALRKKILSITNKSIRRHEPHTTLIHPRNSNCTNEDFEAIKSFDLPKSIHFRTISLIEQIDGGQWQIINTFN
jgi:2'-5' RNA ligase